MSEKNVVRKNNVMKTRIASRILSYQIRILMRIQQFGRIVRHARLMEIFIKSFAFFS